MGAFNLPNNEAIAYLRQPRAVLPAEWSRLLAEDESQANGRILAAQRKIADILKVGGSIKDFQLFVGARGWSIPKGHLEAIFHTAMSAAYNASAWQRFERGKVQRPYLMYSAVSDSRTLPAHRALSGLIRPVDDPFWNDHSPPLGLLCRCSLLALNVTQAEARSAGPSATGLNMPVTTEMVADSPAWGKKPVWA